MMLSYLQYENALVYYFQEAFQLSFTDYGTNDSLDDKQVEKVANKTTTYFLLGQTKYKVDLIFDKQYYHVKFSYLDKDKYSYKMKFDLDSSLKIFNKVMYVVSDVIDKHNIDYLAFAPHEDNTKLKSLYAKMINNKSFLNVMGIEGFRLVKQEDDIYFFSREN